MGSLRTLHSESYQPEDFSRKTPVSGFPLGSGVVKLFPYLGYPSYGVVTVHHSRNKCLHGYAFCSRPSCSICDEHEKQNLKYGGPVWARYFFPFSFYLWYGRVREYKYTSGSLPKNKYFGLGELYLLVIERKFHFYILDKIQDYNSGVFQVQVEKTLKDSHFNILKLNRGNLLPKRLLSPRSQYLSRLAYENKLFTSNEFIRGMKDWEKENI
jgi:hypothetical protein